METMLAKIGLAMFAAALEFARALAGNVSPAELTLKATEYLSGNRSALAAAEARDRATLAGG